MTHKGIAIELTALLLIITLIPAAYARTEPTPWAVHSPTDLPYTRPSPPPQRPPATLPSPTTADPGIIDLILQLNETDILGYVQNLTSYGPRETGSPACDEAAHYLYHTFQAMGLSVRYDNWTDKSLTASNIEATLPGTNDSPFLIVCGHYDCVATGPGADDDGSGVAAVLATANILKDTPVNHTIRFVAFSGEEQGLIGSHHYAEEMAHANASILAVLNADMISYADTYEDAHKGKIYYDDPSEWICQYTENISVLYEPYIGIQVIPSGYLWGSDHNSFWDYGYQAILYFENKFNPYYHSANDTIAHMNLSYAARYSRLILAVLAELTAQPHPLLTITAITGGLGCTATITNIGDAPTHDTTLEIAISPGIFGLIGRIQSWTLIDDFAPGQTMRHRLVSFGLGKVDITVTATASNLTQRQKTATAVELGPFLLDFQQG